jgi:serpin B
MKQLLPYILVGVLALGACSDETTGPETPTPMRSLSTQEIEINRASSSFAFDLFNAIADAEADGNVFISPLSVSMALGMTMNGAQSETWDGMRSALRLGALSEHEINEAWRGLRTLLLGADPRVQLSIANSIWSRDGFPVQTAFIDSNTYYFDAETRALDFNDPGAADVINAWVKGKTAGRIPTIVDGPISPLTMMYLINAVYFKGQWATQFDPAQTREDVFHPASGGTQSVQMMHRDGNMRHMANATMEMVDLPYGWDRFSMAVLLPQKEVSLKELRAQVGNATTWTSLLGQLRDMDMMLQLPRFRIEYDVQLKDVLSALGMEQAFDPNRADFTRINPDGGLYISSVKHKTFVEVNEEGTEAAAVTSVEIGTTSLPPVMRVDRPFLFVIHERNTGAILFIGQVNDLGN